MRSKRAGPPGAAWAGPASADRDAIRIARAPAAKRGGWWRRCPVVPRQACVPPQDRLASARRALRRAVTRRSEEHTSELQSLMRISYAVFCLKKKRKKITTTITNRVINHKALMIRNNRKHLISQT